MAKIQMKVSGGWRTLTGANRWLLVRSYSVRQRQHHLATEHKIQALADFTPCDRVRLNHQIRPLYLHGATGTVTGWAGQSIVVQLDAPTGRFTTGEIRCPNTARSTWSKSRHGLRL